MITGFPVDIEPELDVRNEIAISHSLGIIQLCFLAEINISSCRFFVYLMAVSQLRILCNVEWKARESAELLRMRKLGNSSASGTKINPRPSPI